MSKVICGVYIIINLVDCKVYIGSSCDIKKRITRHKWALKKKIHDNEHLQRAWNKYGEANFEFKILEVCDKKVCLNREQYYLSYYNATNRLCGYNISLKTNMSVISEETRVKMSKSNTGKTHSEEQRKRMSESKKGNTAWVGRKHTRESKEKIRLANTGRKRTEEEIKKRTETRRKNNGGSYGQRKKTQEEIDQQRVKLLEYYENNRKMYGSSHSPDTRNKISKTLHSRGSRFSVYMEDWKELRDKNYTWGDIAKLWDINSGTLFNWRKRNNINW